MTNATATATRPAIGTALYCSWGYDQTNVDFYEVTAHIGKATIEIRPIGQALASAGRGSDSVTPQFGNFTGEPMRKRMNKWGGLTMTTYSNAYPWDGTPKHQTASGWGH